MAGALTIASLLLPATRIFSSGMPKRVGRQLRNLGVQALTHFDATVLTTTEPSAMLMFTRALEALRASRAAR